MKIHQNPPCIAIANEYSISNDYNDIEIPKVKVNYTSCFWGAWFQMDARLARSYPILLNKLAEHNNMMSVVSTQVRKFAMFRSSYIRCGNYVTWMYTVVVVDAVYIM